jgi:hypothetical protein
MAQYYLEYKLEALISFRKGIAPIQVFGFFIKKRRKSLTRHGVESACAEFLLDLS